MWFFWYEENFQNFSSENSNLHVKMVYNLCVSGVSSAQGQRPWKNWVLAFLCTFINILEALLAIENCFKTIFGGLRTCYFSRNNLHVLENFGFLCFINFLEALLAIGNCFMTIFWWPVIFQGKLYNMCTGKFLDFCVS